MPTPIIFKTEHVPAWAHVDPYFHVNSEFYLHYYIDHRFQGLKKELGLGLEQFQKLPFAIFLAGVSIAFLRPLRAEQAFHIHSWVEKFEESNCTVKCEIRVGEKKISECTMNYVCVDIKTGRPTTWPPDFTTRFFAQPQGTL